MSRESLSAKVGRELPPLAKKFGKYVPSVHAGPLLAVCAGPIWGDTVPFEGRFGGDLKHEDAQRAVEITALNVLVQLDDVTNGDLDRVEACLRLGGMFLTTDEFRDHSAYLNVATDLLVSVFGSRILSSRYAIGCNTLPANLCFELEAWFWIKS